MMDEMQNKNGADSTAQKKAVIAPQPKAPVNPTIARIADYRASSIGRQDPLAAMIGTENAALLRLAQQYGPLIEKALTNVKSLADLQELDGPIARRISLGRQIERFSRLDVELTKPRKTGQPNQNPRHEASSSGSHDQATEHDKKEKQT